jgi:formylglycine-generating enzyme required for sulfatase activity
LIILVLGVWILARWGLHELNASETVTRDTSLCEAVPGFGPEMIIVRRGQFLVEAGHTVTVRPFAIGTCEVTFDEYDRFAQATGRALHGDEGWGRGRRPVIQVAWEDAKAYAKWLSQQTGKRYRLPTEAEWEYAARSGGKEEIWAGTSKESELKDYAVYERHRTEPVGSKQPNGLGLHDMSGNVWEWVEDCWHKDYEGAPADGSAWLLTGGGDCGRRVVRGGSWLGFPVYLRASTRDGARAGARVNYLGFRLVQDMNE